MNNALTSPTGADLDLFRIADVFAKSGMFPDARDAAQCAAKLVVGHGLGLTPYDSMNGLHLIKGKAVLAANTMAAAIKRSGKYDYRAVTTETECRITFYDLSMRDENGVPFKIGTSVFTIEDAKRAGLGGDNWRKYPKSMLFARCISNGYREHCPDALGASAAPVYVQEHGESEIPDEPVRGQVESLSSRGRGGSNAPAPVVFPDPEPEPSARPAPKALPEKKNLPADQTMNAGEVEQTEQYSKIQVMDVEPVKRGTKTKYLVRSTDGQTFETFSKTIATQCKDAAAADADVHVNWLPKKIGNKVFQDIESVKVSFVEDRSNEEDSW